LKANVGCFVGNTYAGTLAYADLVLIAPSASAMRKMLGICHNYALDFHVLQCPEVEMYGNIPEF